MGISIKSKDGKTGYFDAKAFIAEQAPSARIMGYDPEAGIIKFKDGDREGEFNVRAMLGDQGAEITKVDELNNAEDAADSSPLTWKERFELGYLTRESSDFQRLAGGISSMFGGKGEQGSDAAIQANEQRAIKQLKTRYDDAKVANGEMVVKHNGVWKKVDSSSDSLGEDASQLLGSTGLNIMGAIAGGVVGTKVGATAGLAAGPLGVAAGGTIGAFLGAVGGSMAAEVAEEATAVGIVGGEVDVEAASRDLLTEGLMAMAGEGISAGLTKLGGKALTPQAVAQMQKVNEIKTEATVVKGLSTIAKEADGKVKDGIAELYSTVNTNLSKAPLREAIDSPENMAKAHAFSKISRNIPDNAPNPLQRAQATQLQEAVDGAFNQVSDEFGAVLGQIRNGVDDRFTIDLEQRVKDLSAASMDAPKDKRAFFDVIENETRAMLEASKKAGNETVLRGKQAFALVERQREIITKKLVDTGAYDKMATPGSEDRLLFNSMHKIKSYFDNEVLFAAEHSRLTKPFDDIKIKYGQVKDAMEVVWSKSFSNKRDLTFASKVAKGDVDPNVTEALSILDNLVPQAKVGARMKDMRLMQAGMEMTPLIKAPDLVRSAGAAGAAVAAGPVGVAAATQAVSPRLAAKGARALAKGSEVMSKAAVAASMPGARKQARAMLGLAYSSGFVRTMGQANSRLLLQNPDMFNNFVQQSQALSKDLSEIDENSAVDAALKIQPKVGQ
jgi:hypothetical protein